MRSPIPCVAPACSHMRRGRQCSHYLPRVTGRWSGRAVGLTDVRSHQGTVARLFAGSRRHGQADNVPNRSSSPATVTGPAGSTSMSRSGRWNSDTYSRSRSSRVELGPRIRIR
jgi:hypothetical protein